MDTKQKYYLKHRERILRQTKKYQQKNKKKISKREKLYYEKNKVSIAKRKRRWYQKKAKGDSNNLMEFSTSRFARRSSTFLIPKMRLAQMGKVELPKTSTLYI